MAEAKIEDKVKEQKEKKEAKEEKKAEKKDFEVETKKGSEEKKEEKKQGSKPAVAKEGKKSGKDEEVKVVLEREYVIPLRRKVQKVPRYRRAKKAIRVIREFLLRHMKVYGGELGDVKIDTYLNSEIWFRGIKKPPLKIKVKARKMSDGIVWVELAEIPEKVKWDMQRDKKKLEKVKKVGKKAKVEEKPVEETKEEKKETEEKEKASVEAGLEHQKQAAKTAKHTTEGKIKGPKHQMRKALKK